MQFVINKDYTFEISDIAINYVDKNGKKTEHDIGSEVATLELNAFLEQIYSNKLPSMNGGEDEYIENYEQDTPFQVEVFPEIDENTGNSYYLVSITPTIETLKIDDLTINRGNCKYLNQSTRSYVI